MAEKIKLQVGGLTKLREMNPMLMSYNVEFAEVTGGTFWKAYTPEQIAGTETFYVESTKDGIEAKFASPLSNSETLCRVPGSKQ